MKVTDIIVGKTYVNRGKGKTRRTVLAIGYKHRPQWLGEPPPPDEPGVAYEQNGNVYRLYLSSFAQWAGREWHATGA